MSHNDGVVITGVGLATPLGLSREATWRRLRAGESGVRVLPPEMGSGFGSGCAAWIDGDLVNERQAPSKTHAVALRAAREALADAELEESVAASLAIIVGNTPVEYDLAHKRALWERGRGGRQVSEDSAYGECALAAWLRERLGMHGPVAALASNCVAGLQAIILGALRIASGRVDRVLVGGVDCAATPEMLARFSLLHALTPTGTPAGCRPFDRAHDGTVLGDGAGFLVLEGARVARARDARVQARLAGWGMTSDSYHVTRGAPDGRAKAAAITQALDRAGMGADGVDLVSAHGTGTVDNDVTEILALRCALGAQAELVPITAAKAALGHSLAACGAVESCLAVLTLRDGIVPPILNLTEAAPECAVGGLVRSPLALRPRAVLKNAFAFGGFNACLVLRLADQGW